MVQISTEIIVELLTFVNPFGDLYQWGDGR